MTRVCDFGASTVRPLNPRSLKGCLAFQLPLARKKICQLLPLQSSVVPQLPARRDVGRVWTARAADNSIYCYAA